MSKLRLEAPEVMGQMVSHGVISEETAKTGARRYVRRIGDKKDELNDERTSSIIRLRYANKVEQIRLKLDECNIGRFSKQQIQELAISRLYDDLLG